MSEWILRDSEIEAGITRYGWYCAECDKIFDGDGKGHNEIRRHVEAMHDIKVAQAVTGLVDRATGDVVVTGWGPRVLDKARRLGFITDKPSSDTKDELEEEDHTDHPPTLSAKIAAEEAKEKEKSASSRSLTKREKDLLKIADQQGRTVTRDIIIPRPVELLFTEAQGWWPELYGQSKDQMSQFIEDFVVGYAIMIGLNTGQRMAEEVAQRFIDRYKVLEEGGMIEDGSAV